MKLPWDKRYLKISFHVIFTLVVFYAMATIIDGAAFVISDLGAIVGKIFSYIGSILGLFSPLIVGLVIAYLFDPIVYFYQEKYEAFKTKFLVPFLEKNNLYINKKNKKKEEDTFKKRFAGTILTYITVLVVFVVIIFLLAHNLGLTGGSLASTSLTEKINQVVLRGTSMISRLETRLEALGFLEFFLGYIDAFLGWLESALINIGNSALSFVASIGMFVINFTISLVIAFYFMNNKARLTHQVKELRSTLLPKKVDTVITNILGDLHAVFSGYIRGLILDGIILGTLVGIGLSLINVDLAILIGVLTAMFNLIPYFGGIMAFFLSVTFELIMGSPLNALYAAIVIIIIQQIDNIFIVPRVLGQKVHLSPPAVMISLSVAGTLFGLLGLLLVVPICATIKIFAGRFIQRYRNRKLAQESLTREDSFKDI